MSGDPGDRSRRRGALHRFREAARAGDVPGGGELRRVSRGAVAGFRADHPGFDADQAEVQLRGLLADLLGGAESDVIVTRGRGGEWGLLSKRPYGYSLLLSPDGSTVLGYSTIHASRTYAQAKTFKEAARGREQDALRVKADRARATLYAHRLAREVARGRLGESDARASAEARGVLAVFERALVGFRGRH